MNYDIHTGAIIGLPGKILAFFASLIVASLPITGFYIWWGRKQKQKIKNSESLKVPENLSAGISPQKRPRSVHERVA
jgi:uncharacterized iron-regulated membrane protein